MYVDVKDSKTTQQKNRTPAIKVTGMPGKHVPPGPLAFVNDLLGAVPPTNGWMLELGYKESDDTTADFECGYRYVSPDQIRVHEKTLTTSQHLHLRRYTHGRRAQGDPRTLQGTEY